MIVRRGSKLAWLKCCVAGPCTPIKRHFSVSELLTLITSLCYSKLYYGSQVWLLPTLKESLYRSLLSQSGQCLKMLNKDLLYVSLHKKYLRAAPKLFSYYHTAVNYYKAINERIYTQEAPNLINNVLSDRRNVILTFVKAQ